MNFEEIIKKELEKKSGSDNESFLAVMTLARLLNVDAKEFAFELADIKTTNEFLNKITEEMAKLSKDKCEKCGK